MLWVCSWECCLLKVSRDLFTRGKLMGKLQSSACPCLHLAVRCRGADVRVCWTSQLPTEPFAHPVIRGTRLLSARAIFALKQGLLSQPVTRRHRCDLTFASCAARWLCNLEQITFPLCALLLPSLTWMITPPGSPSCCALRASTEDCTRADYFVV